jgi:thioredoxin 1
MICFGGVCLPVWPFVLLAVKLVFEWLLPKRAQDWLLSFFKSNGPSKKNDKELNGDFFVTSIDSGPAILMFTASWCGPCRKIKPFFLDLARENPDKKLKLVDIDEATELADKMSINSVPTFVVLDSEGKETARFSGADKNRLSLLVSKLYTCFVSI